MVSKMCDLHGLESVFFSLRTWAAAQQFKQT